MEIITSLLAKPFSLLIDFFINFLVFLSSSFLHLKEEVPAIVDVLNFIKDALVIYLQGYNLLFLLKFVLAWFPNINPFIAPYYIVFVLTQPLLEFLEKRLPKLFGLDLSLLVCSFGMGLAINILSKFRF